MRYLRAAAADASETNNKTLMPFAQFMLLALEK